jgi:hypothetical protein
VLDEIERAIGAQLANPSLISIQTRRVASCTHAPMLATSRAVASHW